MSTENPCGKGSADSGNDGESKEFSCAKCGSSHNTQKGLSIHESKVHGGPVDESGHDCPGCERSYRSRPGVIKHLSGVNSCGGGCECEDCGRTFPDERGLSRHLSEVHGKETYPKVECATCGESFRVEPNREKQSERHFCSRDCCGQWLHKNNSGEDNPQYRERVTLVCEMCGVEYEVKPARASKSVVCSAECRGDYVSEYYSGENGSRWKGGHIDWYGENWYTQRRKARERDNYTCQYCGKDMSGDETRDPDVHHLRRLKWFKDNYDEPEWWQRGNRLENLITACRSCHHQWEGVPVKPQLL